METLTTTTLKPLLLVNFVGFLLLSSPSLLAHQCQAVFVHKTKKTTQQTAVAPALVLAQSLGDTPDLASFSRTVQQLRSTDPLPYESARREIERVNQREAKAIDEIRALFGQVESATVSRAANANQLRYSLKLELTRLHLDPEPIRFNSDSNLDVYLFALRRYQAHSVRMLHNFYAEERAHTRLGLINSIAELRESYSQWGDAEYRFLDLAERADIFPGYDGLTLVKEILGKGVAEFVSKNFSAHQKEALYKETTVIHIRHPGTLSPTWIVLGYRTHWTMLRKVVDFFSPAAHHSAGLNSNPIVDRIVITPMTATSSPSITESAPGNSVDYVDYQVFVTQTDHPRMGSLRNKHYRSADQALDLLAELQHGMHTVPETPQ